MIFFSTSENARTWHIAQHTVLHKLQLKYDLNTVEPLISDHPECWVGTAWLSMKRCTLCYMYL